MKQDYLTLALALALLLAGCASAALPAAEPERAPNTEISADWEQPAAKEPTTARLLIVDGAETGQLVLAGTRGEYDVYTLDVSNVPVTLDGEPADASALEDGMTVEAVFFDEETAQTPAALTDVRSVAAWSRGTAQNPGGTAYDLCGLYLRVLDDLWERDAGLNGGAKYVSVDLSAEPGGLDGSARFAVAWAFARRHGVEALTLGYDELLAQGYLADCTPEGSPHRAYEWRDGVLLRITPDEWAEGEAYSLPVVKFSAEKWRSPLGAYSFSGCVAVWPELGSWDGYRIGGELIA